MQTECRIAKERIPWLMAGARAMLGPVMILGERAQWNGVALAVLIIAALLSDIFDGVLARRWKCDTAGVRLFDSMADIVFYIGCAIALWMRHPSVVRELAVPITAVAGLEALCLAVALHQVWQAPELSLVSCEDLGVGAGVGSGRSVCNEASRRLDRRCACAGRSVQSRRTGDVANHAGVAAGCEDACRGMAAAWDRTARRVKIHSEDDGCRRTYVCGLCSPASRSEAGRGHLRDWNVADRREHHRSDEGHRRKDFNSRRQHR